MGWVFFPLELEGDVPCAKKAPFPLCKFQIFLSPLFRFVKIPALLSRFVSVQMHLLQQLISSFANKFLGGMEKKCRRGKILLSRHFILCC